MMSCASSSRNNDRIDCTYASLLCCSMVARSRLRRLSRSPLAISLTDDGPRARTIISRSSGAPRSSKSSSVNCDMPNGNLIGALMRYHKLYQYHDMDIERINVRHRLTHWSKSVSGIDPTQQLGF